jgi:hypothetical protein
VIDYYKPPISSHGSREAYYTISHGIHWSARRQEVILCRMILAPRSGIPACTEDRWVGDFSIAKFIEWKLKGKLVVPGVTERFG